jgi:hypothetical protein
MIVCASVSSLLSVGSGKWCWSSYPRWRAWRETCLPSETKCCCRQLLVFRRVSEKLPESYRGCIQVSDIFITALVRNKVHVERDIWQEGLQMHLALPITHFKWRELEFCRVRGTWRDHLRKLPHTHSQERIILASVTWSASEVSFTVWGH